MIQRRTFLGAIGGGLTATACGWAADAPRRKRMAVITTRWSYHLHAWHMAERFLVGYPIEGRWHHPALDVVSAYVDQQPVDDLSRARSEEFGFSI